MKKITRAIIAALLVAVMASGCTSAFAAEPADELIWNYYDWEYCYDYAGRLNLGENTITTPEDSYYCYYLFNAEESGFYTIGFTDYVYDGWTGVPEYVDDGVAVNEADCIYHSTENNFRRITFKLEKGENIIGFDLNKMINNKTFEIAYEGNKINSVNIDNKLLLNRDIYTYGEYCEIYADVDLSFSSGTEITLNYVEGVVAKEIEKGINTVTITLFGAETELNVDVYSVTDVVDSVEISNIDDYLNARVYYDGYECYFPWDETFTFTLKDGSTQTIVFSSDSENVITLPDGTEANFYFATESEGDEIVMNVMIADCVIRSYDCTEVKASSDENFANLLYNARNNFTRASRYFRYAFIAVLDCDTLEEFIDYGAHDSANYFRYSASTFLEIFKEFFSFMAFLA